MSSPFLELVLACAAFVGSHFLLSSTPIRGAVAGRLGERAFFGLYSALALALFVWMVRAYGEAPYVELWAAIPWIRWTALVLMLIACVFMVAAATSPNPSLPLAGEAAARAAPSPIIRVTRHPILWGLGLWGVVHMLANGDGASLVYFGSFAVLALAGTVLLDRKKRALLGKAWESLEAQTSNLPLAAVLAGRTRVGLLEIGYGRLAGGLVLYIIILLAHEFLFGVSPLPG